MFYRRIRHVKHVFRHVCFLHRWPAGHICDMKKNHLYKAALLLLLAAVVGGFSLMLKVGGEKIEMGTTVLAGSPIIVFAQ